MLFLKYEDLIEKRPDHVQLLELFTGVENIDPRTFDVKVNTYEGSEAEGHAPDQYIRPAALTKSDRAAVLDQAGKVMERLYSDLAKAA